MCKFLIKTIVFLFLFLFSISYVFYGNTQELAPPENNELVELDPQESETTEDGDPEDLPPDEKDEEEVEGSHLLTFTLNARFQFIDLDLAPGEDKETKAPYMENQYSVNFAVPINLDKKRGTTSLQAEYEIDNWGDFSTEYFDCRLEIAIESLPVTVTTNIISEVDEETDEILNQELTLKIDFGAEIQEEWSGFCLALTGDQLNSQGDSENYLYQATQSSDPPLSQIVLDDFQFNDSSEVLLTIPLTIFTDNELNNDVMMEGEIKIEIDAI